MSSKSHEPLVTIAIPSYNQEEFIGETISSILAQTHQNIELLVYDDCSKDRTVQVVSSFDDSRVKLIKADYNLGPEGNWNRCLSEIKGEYFLLVPGDDTLFPSYLEKKLEVFKADTQKKLAIVGCDRTIINSNGKQLMSRGFPPGAGEFKYSQILSAVYKKGTNVIGEPGSGLVRGEVAKKVGAYRAKPGYLIDLDFWLRALQFGNYYHLDVPLCTFRISKVSWSARIGFDQRNQFMEFVKRFSKETSFKPSPMELVSVSLSSYYVMMARMAFFKLVS